VVCVNYVKQVVMKGERKPATKSGEDINCPITYLGQSTMFLCARTHTYSGCKISGSGTLT
jgi:hypothetical protein